MKENQMLWRCLGAPGHEAVRLVSQDSSWLLTGSAVFLHEDEPCQLRYWVICDFGWHTRSVQVEGWIGDRDIDVSLLVDASGHWKMNGEVFAAVYGCIDVDLNFTPSTNLLPIRRLQLELGQAATVRSAWLRFPSFQLESLEQLYRRTGVNRYRYESGSGEFSAELQVSAEGLVKDYPPVWQAEPSPYNAFNTDAGKARACQGER